MIRIHFLEPTTPDWVKWREKCEQETQALISEFAKEKTVSIKGSVYKGSSWGIKDKYYFALSAPFYGKCAYCEQKVHGNQCGDIEHYRPKAEVTDIDNNPVLVAAGAGTEPHPGYFWLAYDHSNLLPICNQCNTRQKDKGTGAMIGKGTRFPVRGSYATAPEELDEEQPLLLNPLKQDPDSHFRIDETGVLVAQTPEGEATRDVLGLNLRDLPNDRARVYEDVTMKFAAMIDAEIVEKGSERSLKLRGILARYVSGEAPLSMAGRQALRDASNRTATLLAGIAKPPALDDESIA
ncbi:MAG: hypothetical protein CMJ58_11215 [Planctomycetaceae bacterium]|nr:hypothetical protein [Planctomycetaceae bacterium]